MLQLGEWNCAGQLQVARALGSSLKILLVDENPLQASVRKSILEKRFADVLRVTDAAEALCLVEQPKVAHGLSLVVSGHQLTGIGGPAFVAELHTRIPSLPVLVLGDSIEEFAAYARDYVSFLCRPVQAEELLATALRIVAQNAHMAT